MNTHHLVFTAQLLPTPVDPAEAEEMFDFADKDGDCRISWEEFQVKCCQNIVPSIFQLQPYCCRS